MNETTTLEQADGHEAEHGHDPDHAEHPSDWKYVQIALWLGALTAIEVSTYFFDDQLSDGFLIATLTVLMVIKFSMVAWFFMHLKFDSRIYTQMFGAGVVLAVGVYFIMLFASNLFG